MDGSEFVKAPEEILWIRDGRPPVFVVGRGELVRRSVLEAIGYTLPPDPDSKPGRRGRKPAMETKSTKGS